ncbi:neuropathy target esterase-like isoform X1 [Lingula anatina]|uniref:Neuropathy target esterase-like isoform X1 n=1 Tax=Lingula anatina TaxID=7574 RepID=A0A1S3IF56_LINAN|nr:neuropathy target esterase-like isoform X1 [Lingula anatina]|eukprot:XP_013396089.1 neuropathy target esterase-like isoform X1 [Lingula anatina]
MSLAGYMPPLCDPMDGHLLMDGGYVNNLPADVMKTMGAQTIFAIDVGSQDETNLTNYGDKLSGWWLLWKRWNPWAEPVKVPNMSDVQSRLAYVSCVRQMEMVTNSGMCEYLRPPIDKYGTLQFGSFDEIYDVGYNHGKVFFSAMAKGDAINELFKEKSKDRVKPKIHQCFTPLNATFTDLAELVSRIEEPPKFYTPSDETDSEDMDEDGDDIIEVVEEGEDEDGEEYEDEEEEEEEEGMEPQPLTTSASAGRLKPKHSPGHRVSQGLRKRNHPASRLSSSATKIKTVRKD